MSGIIGISPDMRSGVIGAWPSGHVIQIVSDRDTGTARTTTNNTATTWNTDLTGLGCTLTTRMANSKVKISAGSNMTITDQQIRVDIVRAVTGGATTRGLNSAYSNSNNNYGWITHRSENANNDAEWKSVHADWIDEPSLAAGTTVTYSLAFKNGGGTSLIHWCHDAGASYLIIEEIAV